MSEALSLYRLQVLDSRIDKISNRLDQIEHILNDDRHVRQATMQWEKAQNLTKKIRTQLNQIEDKVAAQRLKRKTNQATLFSGTVKNPKVLQDLQMEAEALKRYITQLEDDQLETMIAFETAENAEKQALQTLNQVKGTVVENNAALIGEQRQLKEDFNRISREREAVLQSISSEALTLYNKLRKAKHGVAVTPISDGGCSICGQALTPAVLQSIRASNKIVFCPSCGRILYEN